MTKYNVMILEDDLRASYMLESAIKQDEDFTVVSVSESYSEALLQYAIYQPQLIFIDMTLPDGHGLEFIQRMRKQGARCDFIITTADRDIETLTKAIRLGVSDYLVKPIRMSRVYQALKDYDLYKQQVSSNSTVDQKDIDLLLRKVEPKDTRKTPKGIDSTTLGKLKALIVEEQLIEFSSTDIGERMNVSRITARRYLEFLESEGVVKLVLNYNTGGRPKRLYRVT